LQWIHKSGYKIYYDDIIYPAARVGNKRVLTWAHEQNLKFTAKNIRDCGSTGNLELVQWIVDKKAGEELPEILSDVQGPLVLEDIFIF